MQVWDTKTRHSPCSIRPTKTGPTTCLPIWRPTLAWIASAPTRALGNSIGASDYLSDASCWLRPSVGCGQVVGPLPNHVNVRVVRDSPRIGGRAPSELLHPTTAFRTAIQIAKLC